MTEERKNEHIDISLNMDVESEKGSSAFQDIHLIHQALSDLDFHQVMVNTSFLGKTVGLPLIIVSMTGGSERALKINEMLASIAEEFLIPIGVGSLRAGLEDASLLESFKIVTKVAPSVPIISNIGVAQLLNRGSDAAIEAVELIEADALAIHLNKLQEIIMPEGEPQQRGLLKILRSCVDRLSVPIILKETGSGMSFETASVVKSLGINYVDIGGRGGTNFAKIEQHRALRANNLEKTSLGEEFLDWGIPTAISLIEALSVPNLHVVATGGIRGGLDAAKALAIGAHMVGVGLPLLRTVSKGRDQTKKWIADFSNSLKCAMFLVGAKDLQELRESPLVLTGLIRSWLDSRDIPVERFTKRC